MRGVLRALCTLLFGFAAALALAACDQTICFNGTICIGGSTATPPPDAPGSYSYYYIMNFPNNSSLNDFCDGESWCTSQVHENLGSVLAQHGWQAHNSFTDGYVNGSWTAATQASQMTNDTANLMYVFTHGGPGASSGQSIICLRYCDGTNYGGSTAWSTQLLPDAWHGPTWLLLDACEVTQPGMGWESKFGGSLHGILGHDNDGPGLTASALNWFANETVGYAPAVDTWEKAVASSTSSYEWSYLVPQRNLSDAIEAPGGPHYGYDGDTNPTYMHCCSASQSIRTGSQAFSSSTSTYSLVPEQMDETYWYNTYGGSSVSSQLTYPNGNEHDYRNPYVFVRHYLASGGLIVGQRSTGSAAGFSDTDAYNYAVSWINSNGGFPSDAVLTFAGAGILYPQVSVTNSTKPYPNVRHYTFVWRHATNGIQAGDKMQIDIDDDGRYERDCTDYDPPLKNHCYTTSTWDPQFHVSVYVRVWRQLGSAISVQSTSTTVQTSGTYVGSALCASDMSDPSSTASPCQAYQNPTTRMTTFYSSSTATPVGGSESL